MATVLITGGSSGIGLEISKYFAQAGYQILWASLLEEELTSAKLTLEKAVPEVNIDTLCIDLSQTEAAEQTYHWVKTQTSHLDVLINNAGFATYGYTSTIAVQKEIEMIHLNVLSLFKLTRFFLEDMLEADAGSIINISSNTAFQPVPKMAAYASTKAFVAHYSRSLQEELKAQKSKVHVMTVYPAAIRNTKFRQAASMERVKTFEGLVATTQEEVAKDVWKGFKKGKDFVLTGAKLRRLRWLQKLSPHALVQFLLRKELEER